MLLHWDPSCQYIDWNFKSKPCVNKVNSNHIPISRNSIAPPKCSWHSLISIEWKGKSFQPHLSLAQKSPSGNVFGSLSRVFLTYLLLQADWLFLPRYFITHGYTCVPNLLFSDLIWANSRYMYKRFCPYFALLCNSWSPAGSSTYSRSSFPLRVRWHGFPFDFDPILDFCYFCYLFCKYLMVLKIRLHLSMLITYLELCRRNTS